MSSRVLAVCESAGYSKKQALKGVNTLRNLLNRHPELLKRN